MIQRPKCEIPREVEEYINYLEDWIKLKSKNDDFGMLLTYKKKLLQANAALNKLDLSSLENITAKDDKTIEKVRALSTYAKELLEYIEWVRDKFVPEKDMNKEEVQKELDKIPLIERSARSK